MLLLSLKSTAFLVDDDSFGQNTCFCSFAWLGIHPWRLDVFHTDKEAWRCTQAVLIVSLSRWIIVDERSGEGWDKVYFSWTRVSQSLAKTFRDAKWLDLGSLRFTVLVTGIFVLEDESSYDVSPVALKSLIISSQGIITFVILSNVAKCSDNLLIVGYIVGLQGSPSCPNP